MVTNLRQRNIIRKRSPGEIYRVPTILRNRDFFQRECWGSLTGSIRATINILQILAWGFSVVLDLNKIN